MTFVCFRKLDWFFLSISICGKNLLDRWENCLLIIIVSINDGNKILEENQSVWIITSESENCIDENCYLFLILCDSISLCLNKICNFGIQVPREF